MKKNRLEVIHMYEDIDRSEKIFSFQPYFIHRLTRSKIFFNFFLTIKIVNYLLHCDVIGTLPAVEFEEALSAGLRLVRAAFLCKHWNPQK